MKKNSPIHIPPTCYTKDYIYLDTSFILLFPYTEINNDIQNIFIASQIPTLYSKKDISSSLSTIIPRILTLEEATSEIEKFKNVCFIYKDLMQQTEIILNQVLLESSLSYKNLENFITSTIFPNVKIYPFLFLMPQDFERISSHLTFDILLRFTLFITALLESPTLNEFSDKQTKINIAMSAFLSEIGRLQIIKKSTPYITEDGFSHPKIQELISKISLAMLKKWRFPKEIICTIKEIKSFINPQKLNITKINKTIQTEMHGQFISIGNYYVKNLCLKKNSPRTVLLEIEKNTTTHFNKELANNIKQILGPIPTGTYVKLKNNTHAVVLYTPQKTQHPIVQVLTDNSNNPQKKIVMISSAHPDFRIIEEASQKRIYLLKKLRATILEKDR